MCLLIEFSTIQYSSIHVCKCNERVCFALHTNVQRSFLTCNFLSVWCFPGPNNNVDIRSFLGKGNVLDSSGQTNKASTATKSATSKKPTGNVTNTGPPSSKPPGSSDCGNAGTAKGDSLGRKGRTDDINSDLPIGVEHWGGGIWTPEKSIPHSSAGVGLENGGTENGSGSNDLRSKENATAPRQQTTWTVVQTSKDKEMKAGSTDTGDRVGSAGHMLGSDSSDGLSWLARMRKQWADAKGDTAKPSTSKQQEAQTVGSTKKQQSELKTTKPRLSSDETGLRSDQKMSGTGKKPVPTTAVTKPCDDGETVCVSPSDNSFHDSFHVSSCEEDNWPTPEKYYTENKTSSVGRSKRKRTAIDLTSSDEEDSVLPAVSKRVKQPTEVKSSRVSKHSGSESDHSENVFHRVKTKNKSPSEDKTDLPRANNFSPPGSGCGEASTENHTCRSIPVTASSTSSQANAPHSSGARLGAADGNAADISLVACPSCQRKVPAEHINDHLDMCLS